MSARCGLSLPLSQQLVCVCRVRRHAGENLYGDQANIAAKRYDHSLTGVAIMQRCCPSVCLSHAANTTVVWVVCSYRSNYRNYSKRNGSPYTTAERRVPELIPVLGSQPAGDVSHKPGSRLPLLPARSAVTLATLNRAATSFAAW